MRKDRSRAGFGGGFALLVVGSTILASCGHSSSGSSSSDQRGACAIMYTAGGTVTDGPLSCDEMGQASCASAKGTFYQGQTCAAAGYTFCCDDSLAKYRFRSLEDAQRYDAVADPNDKYPDCATHTITCPASTLGTSDGGGSSGGGCDGAPEGGYKCPVGTTTISVCKGGTWVVQESCDCAVKVGDPRKPPYAATCKSGATSYSIKCDYAGVECKSCPAGSPCSITCTTCATANSSSCCP